MHHIENPVLFLLSQDADLGRNLLGRDPVSVVRRLISLLDGRVDKALDVDATDGLNRLTFELNHLLLA